MRDGPKTSRSNGKKPPGRGKSRSPGQGKEAVAALVDLRQQAAANLAVADDEEPHRVESRELWVRQDVIDVVGRQRFPLVQADEDVAALKSGPPGDAVGGNFRH